MAIDLNIRRAHVELDCLALVQKLNNPERDLSAVGPWVQEIKALLSSMEEAKLSWVHRSGNVPLINL